MTVEEVASDAEGASNLSSLTPRTAIQAIDRAVRLLHIVAAAGHTGAGLSQIATAAELHNSTCRTLLNSLVVHQMLDQDPLTRRYMLGTRFIELNRLHASQTDLTAAATPVVKRLWESTRETVHLAVLQGGRRVDLTVLVSPQILNVNPVVKDSGAGLSKDTAAKTRGERQSLLTTAAGKILLSGLDASELQRLFVGRRSPRSEADSSALDEQLGELEAVKSLGYATNFEQDEPGVCGVAAAVRDHAGTVCAALCVGYPSVRSSPAYDALLRDQVVATAGELSLLLGAPNVEQAIENV